MNMKKSIGRGAGLCCGLVLLSSLMVIEVIAQEPPQSQGSPPSAMTPYIYGTCRCFFAKAVYWGVENNGGIPLENVSGVFTVSGGFQNSISFTDSYIFGTIETRSTYGRFITKAINGFGPLTLSLDATSSNAEPLSISVPGFQVGFRTFVFYTPMS